MSIARQGAAVFGTRVVQLFLALLLSVLVNRVIGPENRGVLELLSTIPVLMVNIGNLGIGNAALYFLGKKTYDSEEVISTSVIASFGIGLVLCSILVGMYVLFQKTLFTNVTPLLIVIILIMIPVTLIQKVLSYVMLAQGKIYIQNKINITTSLLTTVLVLVLVVWLRLAVVGAILSTLLNVLFALCIYAYVTTRDIKMKLNFNLEIFKNSFNFGLVPFLALAVMNLIFRSDVFLVKYFLNDIQLGYYGISVSLCERVWMIPESVGLVVLMKAARSADDDSVHATARVCRVTLWLTAACCLLLGIVAPFVVPLLYGAAYVPAVLPLQILLPGIAFIAVFLVLHSDLTGKGQAKYTLYVFILCLILNIVLNTIFIPLIGISGSALSSTISYCAGSIALAVIYAKKYGIGITDLFILERRDIDELLIPLFNRLK